MCKASPLDASSGACLGSVNRPFAPTAHHAHRCFSVLAAPDSYESAVAFAGASAVEKYFVTFNANNSQ